MKEIDYEEKETKKKRKSDGGNPLVSAFITFIVCFLAFVIYRNYYMTIDQQNTIDNTNNNEVSKLEKSVTITDNGIADAVEKVYDSVVVIETYINDKAYSTGTGFVFKTNDKYGYIMTNHHVIANSNKIKVTFTNNKTVEATLVGSDEYSDIAVLTVNKKDVISVCEIGSSSKMRVGDTTFAVGAPIDSSVYSWTVTRGILSGKNRLVEVSGTNRNNSFIMEVLQTDAAINSGNSGGPLLNNIGQVIGVNSMKISDAEGIALAIPISSVVSFMEGNDMELTEDKTVDGHIEYSPHNALSDEEDSEETVRKGKTSPLTIVLAILLGISFLLNVVLIVILVYRKNKDIVVPVDSRDRTDFEIDIME